MHGLLEAQRAALDAWRAGCARRPEVHRHQLLALDRELVLAAAAADLAGYRRAGGGGVLLGRAAGLDRLAGRLRSAVALGEVHDAQAALTDYRTTIEAGEIARGPAASAAADAAAGAGTQLTRTVLGLLLERTQTPGRVQHGAAACAAWEALCAADPAAAADVQRAVPRLPRVAHRLPWRAHGRLQRELAALPPPETEVLDAVGDPLLALAELEAGWRQRIRGPAALERTWEDAAADLDRALAPWRELASSASAAPAVRAVAAVARRLLEVAAGAASSAEAQRRWLEAGLPAALAAAPHLARAAELEARQRVWPQPLLAAHAASLRAALASARTDTEVEVLAGHAAACLAVEADWQTLLYTAALAPLRAAAMVAVAGEAELPALREAVTVVHELLGLGPRALLRLPLVSACVSDDLAPALADRERAAGAWHGEAGYEVVPTLAAWAAASAPAGADPSALARTLPQALAALHDQVAAGEPLPVAVAVQRWGRPLSPLAWGRWDDDLRPPPPGWPPRADAPAPL